MSTDGERLRGITRGTKDCADYAAQVGQDMFRAGIQECLRLAKEHLSGGWGGEINGWDDLERALERL